MPLAPLHEEDVEFVLTRRRWCTPVVAELTLSVSEHAMDFAPGQYVLLQDEQRTVPVRSYSAANAPRTDGALVFLVTAVPGGPTSTWLASDAAIGSRVLVSGPYGTFVADPTHDGPTLYLAGGSGLAPARSLLEALTAAAPFPGPAGERKAAGEQRARGRHTLLFSARTPADVIDEEIFSGLARAHPWFRYVRTLTRAEGSGAAPPLGRVPEVLPALLPDLSQYAVYISGSPGFVAACTRTATLLGVHPGRLHTEEFYAEPAPWSGSAPPPHSTDEETP